MNLGSYRLWVVNAVHKTRLDTLSGETIQDGKEQSSPCALRGCSHGKFFLCRVTYSFDSLKYHALLSCPFSVKGALCDMKVNKKNLRRSCHSLKFCARMKTHTVFLLSLFRLTLMIVNVTWILNDFHIKRKQNGCSVKEVDIYSSQFRWVFGRHPTF